MSAENFNWKAMLILHTSGSELKMSTDAVRHWYFMKVDSMHWSFDFRTEHPDKLMQNIATEIECCFLAQDAEIQKVPLKTEFDVLSGLNAIGKITLIGPV